MIQAAEIEIFPLRPEDHDFVLAVTHRLADFGPPPWRSPEDVVGGELRALRRFLAAPEEGKEIFVAAKASGERLGFIFLETFEDYFAGTRQGHVGIVAVTAEAQGSGAGRALLAHGEAWAREQGFRRLTLNVFWGNARAREVYERFGFEREMVRYVKLL